MDSLPPFPPAWRAAAVALSVSGALHAALLWGWRAPDSDDASLEAPTYEATLAPAAVAEPAPVAVPAPTPRPRPRRSEPRPRVAWTDGFGDCPVTADTRRSLAALAYKLEQAGWSIHRACPDLNFDELWQTFGQVLWCEIGSSQPPEIETETTRGLLALGDDPITRGMRRMIGATMRQFTAIMTVRDGFIAGLERFLDNYDVCCVRSQSGRLSGIASQGHRCLWMIAP